MGRPQLIYAQNWEDADLERTALAIGPADEVIAVTGGGCTVLSLLADGPRRLRAVDCNPAQLELLRLKLAAATTLSHEDASAFLGGTPAHHRLATFESLRHWMPPQTYAFWSARKHDVERGVISRGRIEKYFAALRMLVPLVHSRRTIEALFTPRSLDEQAHFYRQRWDTPGWRRIFLLTHKRILDRVLNPSFYRYVNPGDLSLALRNRAEQCMTRLPMATNYFLSWILRGRYPDDPAGRPPYLHPSAGDALRRHQGRLRVCHSDLRDLLDSLPESSCDKFSLSNVGEWLSDAERAPFFESVIRVARDGAVVCQRALMADRPLPESVAGRLVEDPARSRALAGRDRAFVNAGFHLFTVRKEH